MTEPYSLDDFPADERDLAPLSAEPSGPRDGRLMACGVSAIEHGLPEGHRDAGAYQLALQCAHVGIAQREATELVQAFIDRCGGADKPRARTKVRSAYSAERPPLGCEFWESHGIDCDAECPVRIARNGAAARTVTIRGTVRRPEPVPPERHDRGQTDFALAREWAASVQETLLYAEGDQWWRYEAGRWRYCSSDLVQARVQDWLARQFREGRIKAPTLSRVRNVLGLAKSELGPHSISEFDARRDWIPLANGVYDISTGELLPHSPANKLTHQATFAYDEAARAPLWTRLLREWLIHEDGTVCEEWVDLLQEWFGYCLIPDATAQTSMMWVGEGGNGKGVATRVLEGLVGREYCAAVPIELLDSEYQRAHLYGKLVGFVNEPSTRGMQRNGSIFKALTGGDMIQARRPTEKVFEFTPHVRIILSCNALPRSDDPSMGYYRRIIVVQWRYDVPAGKRDPLLDDALRAELPGIFNWALEGLRRFLARGRRFTVPAESARLLEEYRLSEDTVGRFVSEECELAPKALSVARKLYAAYKKWADEMGHRPVSETAFGVRLRRYRCQPERPRISGVRTRCWSRIRLSDGAADAQPDWTLDGTGCDE